MSECAKCQNLFVEALYGDLSPDKERELKIHLDTCENCSAEFEGMATTLKVMDQRKRPEPTQAYWDGYWDRLAQRLEGDREASRGKYWWKALVQVFNVVPRWAYRAGTAAVLIVIGIFIGRQFFGPSASRMQAVHMQGQSAEDVQLVGQAMDYIERSRVMILSMVNFDPETDDPYALDLPYQKQLSGQMVREAADLKDRLEDPTQEKLRELIVDLEIILKQIANLESEHDLSAVEFVKSGVDSQAILLRINTLHLGGFAFPSPEAGSREKASAKSNKI